MVISEDFGVIYSFVEWTLCKLRLFFLTFLRHLYLYFVLLI